MKIIISNRSVYHKYAQVEINIPDTIKTDDVLDYLQENEHLYNDKIDEQMFFVLSYTVNTSREVIKR